MKLISFCVYGNAPRYLRGIVENARLWPAVFPDWRMRVYAESGLSSEIIQELEALGVHVVPSGLSLGASGMLWRVMAAWDAPEATHVIFRDADSRLNAKEAAAVKEWVDSGLAAHCMYDHPYHTMPLMGGAWGIREGLLPQYARDAICTFINRPLQYMDDQTLLAACVYPRIADSMLRHSSVPSPWSRPFPPHAPIVGFVSQIYGDDMKPQWPKDTPRDSAG